MNPLFLNRLADVIGSLEPHALDEHNPHLADMQEIPTDDLPRLDRFCMLSDAQEDTLVVPWVPDSGLAVGGIEAWAAYQAALDKGLSLPVPYDQITPLAASAIGLPGPPPNTPPYERTSALYAPAALMGRMDAITPAHAARVLRDCAGGRSPLHAWNEIAADVRALRLNRLAETIEGCTVPDLYTGLHPVETDWRFHTLREHLRHFTTYERQEPYALDDNPSVWGGDVTIWALALFGNETACSVNWLTNHSTDLLAATLLGLSHLEAALLFNGVPEPRRRHIVQADDDLPGDSPHQDALDMASNLRMLATGAFPGIYWEDFCGLEIPRTSYVKP